MNNNEKKYKQTLVMAGFAALESTIAFCNEYEAKLSEEFSKPFIWEVLQQEESLISEEEMASLGFRYTDFSEDIPVKIDAVAAQGEFGIRYMKELSGTGVFGGLWEMGEMLKAAFEVELKRIPVKQHTIEICNFLDYNPYQISSKGSILVVCDRGWELCHHLSRSGISAVVIGNITDGNDRVVIYDDKSRFLEPVRA